MRKRLMNISKRCMVAIMSAAFVMSSVTVSMAIPVGVYALDNNVDNNAYIDSAIDTNTGTGVNVLDTGSVQTNSGGIHDNNGTVVNNTGVIENNFGTVTNNYGMIESNISGNIMNQYDGTVINGYGTITNYFGGDISAPSQFGPSYVTNNFADITTDTPAAAVNAANQYLSVTLTDMDGANATYNAAQFTEAYNKQYLKVKNNGEAIENVQGTIELSAKQGYSLSLADSFPVNETYGYELNMDAGKYYLTIYRPTASLTISPRTLVL